MRRARDGVAGVVDGRGDKMEQAALNARVSAWLVRGELGGGQRRVSTGIAARRGERRGKPGRRGGFG